MNQRQGQTIIIDFSSSSLAEHISSVTIHVEFFTPFDLMLQIHLLVSRCHFHFFCLLQKEMEDFHENQDGDSEQCRHVSSTIFIVFAERCNNAMKMCKSRNGASNNLAGPMEWVLILFLSVSLSPSLFLSPLTSFSFIVSSYVVHVIRFYKC